MALTVMKLPETTVIQEIYPPNFGIYQCDCKKNDVGVENYFNLGYFAVEGDGTTVPIGNLVIDGKTITQSCDNPSWINVAGKELTTIGVTTDGEAKMFESNHMDDLPIELWSAISGIPILKDSVVCTMDDIKSEGYFGTELYHTYHGFLGLRYGNLVYVAMKCSFETMGWALLALGITDAIKLDGGGSFILHNGNDYLLRTDENRRINNVGMWQG